MSTSRSWSAPPSGGTVAGEHFDVIVVGARCAGSSLATMLARAGLKVAVIEQVRFPKPTLSSHLMEADGIQFLQRLGVLEEVRATGVRFMQHVDLRLNELRLVRRWPLRFDDLGGALFLRRHLLDSILADAAVAAGADVRFGTKVVELLWDRDRVCGVRVQDQHAERRLCAPLVVGADGRSSIVGHMTGARKYNINPNGRSYYFTFFEGAKESANDTFVFHRWGDRMVWAGPADSGLYLVGISPEGHEREYFRTHTQEGLLAHLRRCEPTAEGLADARIATQISGIRKFDGYFRQASGRGWVLAGDSGHFKDPAAGRGIGDAFLQVDALAPAIVSGLDGSADGLDNTLARWGEWRDKRLQSYYWLATDLGGAGTFPSMVPEAVRRLEERGELSRFFDLFSHRTDYYDVFPLRDVGLATGRMLLRGEHKRLPLMREAVTLLAREPRRRWINKRPALAASEVVAAPADRVRRGGGTANGASNGGAANGSAANGNAANGSGSHGSAAILHGSNGNGNGAHAETPAELTGLVPEAEPAP
ncbi:MAG TPA: NAD(P)/FAD-dependent oxidoreductase [Jatrophihabitans sp.]|nr:NAD(P)/FAD-dependent oxidoreductase [Jatrophihabitans sp.]